MEPRLSQAGRSEARPKRNGTGQSGGGWQVGVLQRYKAGLMDIQQARQGLALLLAILSARQAQIEVKLERLEAILEVRN